MNEKNPGRKLPKNICQLKDGRYLAKYTSKFGGRPEKKFKTLEAAKKWLKEAKEKETNSYEADEYFTVDQWYKYWLENLCKNRADNTVRNYKDRYSKNISPVIGKMQLVNLKPIHCQQVIAKMEHGVDYYGKPYSSGTVEMTYNTLRVLFKSAEDLELISRNPARRIAIDKTRKNQSEDEKFLTLEEHRKFLESAKKSRSFPQFRFMLETGIRPGELIGLTFDDVDWTNKTLTIRKSVEFREGSWHAGPPKTKTSYRTIPLTEAALTILKDAKEAKQKMHISPKAKQILFYKDIKTGRQNSVKLADLIFISKQTGMPTRNNAYDSCLTYICRRAGIKEISMHDLRHTYATRCVERGVPYKSLQKLLGHSSLKVTMDTYVHVTEESLRDAVDIFEANSQI